MGKYKGVIALIYILLAAAAAVCAIAAGLADTIDFLTGDPTFTGRTPFGNTYCLVGKKAPISVRAMARCGKWGLQIGAQLRAAQ